ncbi:MAG: acyl carrier protein [Cellvibrionaceae bacterium]
MTKMSTSEVVSWLENLFEEASGSLGPTTTRDKIEGWDSIGTLSLIAELDECFGIRPSEDELEALDSVSDVVALMLRNDQLKE